MGEEGIDALLIYAAPFGIGPGTMTSGNIRYIVGWVEDSKPSLLVLPLAGDPALLLQWNPLARRPAEKGIWVTDVRYAADPPSLGEVAKMVLNERGVTEGRVGFIGRDEAAPIYENFAGDPCPWRLIDADLLLVDIKMVKAAEEIQAHRMAAKISDSMQAAAMSAARVPGKWAFQLIADMEHTARTLGADYAAAWVATGPAPEFIANHPWENMRQLKPGDRVHVGTFVTYEGYWGQSIRIGTIGRANAQLKHYTAAVIEAQDAALEALRPGRPMKKVVGAMKRTIRKHSPHAAGEDLLELRTGHVLGTQYAEPVLSDVFSNNSGATESQKGDEVLVQSGMVVELHPSLSVAGLGWISIGDVALVTEQDASWLTKFPREVFEI